MTYEERVKHNLEGLHAVSVGLCPGCEVCADAHGVSVEEFAALVEDCEVEDAPSFSWQWCDSCGSSLGGDRHAAHALDENDNIIHLDVCTACLMYLSYGEIPE